jgi:hypothetical protein
VAWLSVQFKVLLPKCTKRSLYSTLKKIYDKRMEPLRRQKMDVPDVSREQIERHFETHQLSHTRGLQEDARICKQLQAELHVNDWQWKKTMELSLATMITSMITQCALRSIYIVDSH